MAENDAPQVPVEVLQKSQLLDALYQDPKTRDETLKLIKTKYPEVRIPEIEVADRFGAIEKRLEEREAEREKKWAEREAQQTRAKAIEAMRAKGVPDAEVPEVEKLMSEGQIGDPATAAELYVTRRAAATPRSAPSFTFDLPDQKELFGTASQRKNWARKEAARALAELRGGR